MTKQGKIITGAAIGLVLAIGIGIVVYKHMHKASAGAGDDSGSGGGGGGGGGVSDGKIDHSQIVALYQRGDYKAPIATTGTVVAKKNFHVTPRTMTTSLPTPPPVNSTASHTTIRK